MNGAFNRVDKNILYLLQQGVPEWNNAVQYPVGAIIKYKDKIYRCLIENSNGTPSTNTTKWELLIKNSSEKDKGIIQIATTKEVEDGVNDLNVVTPLKLRNLLDKYTVRSAVTVGYDPLFQYESGDIVKENGIYYECYSPNGCKGIDPTDPRNRPSEWTDTDIHAPYYWIEIGRYLMLPEIGSPIYLMTMQHREGLIKLRNDAQLSATKFWRVAELNPNIVKDGFIELADLRANVIRSLDDGKGVDAGRTINSYQADAIKNFTGELGFHDNGFATVFSGIFKKTADSTLGLPNFSTGWGFASKVSLDFSSQIAVANEMRIKNIAMLACIRI